MRTKILAILALTFAVAPPGGELGRSSAAPVQGNADIERFRESWRVLEPITRRNLSVYPVVSSARADTSEFLTLDEGLSSGQVRIGERGELENALFRRRNSVPWPWSEDTRPDRGGASVNELVLVNNSSRPLILLAGEVVSGGKQNRIIGSDLVVPPKSEPLPLTVFCVEHGRWSEGSTFGAAKIIAAPAIRTEAQAKKSQQGVWDSVSRAAGALAVASPTASYQDVVNSPRAMREFEEVAKSIESDYEKELREQLRGRNAVGVLVAINGELVWSDIFSTPELFQKYWPKLLRSYVMEAESHGSEVKRVPSARDAEAFLLEYHGRVNIQIAPGVYRRTEISGKSFEIVSVEALGKSADSGLLLHYNKMKRD